ncbi:uncharacterized protein LOC143295177 [Babylonia areolata]|uniref:uncharacterized protein LOC143295177 n=1 Tax=Babylonia areolata TaxID=304850 RepID=UPI003FCFACEE
MPTCHAVYQPWNKGRDMCAAITVCVTMTPAEESLKEQCGLLKTANYHSEHCQQINADSGRSKIATTASRTGMTTKGTKADLEAAKAAVLFMDLPEALVQLVIDLQPLEPDLSFSDAQQLYEVTSQLLSDTKRQAALVKKLHHHHHHQQQQEAELKNHEKKEKEGGDSFPSSSSPSSTSHADADPQQQLPGRGKWEGPHQLATLAVLPTSPASSSASSSPPLIRPAVTSGCSSSELMTDSVPAMTLAFPSRAEEADKQPPEGSPSSVGNIGKASRLTGASSSLKTSPPPPPAPEEEVPTTELLEEEVGQNPESVSIGGPSHQQAEEDLLGPDVVAVPSSRKRPREKVRRLAEEKRRLTQRKMCRACRQVELSSSGVTFLPCGHFITCEVCSETFKDCPACGKVIMATVRTFLS